jgi:hypothetical protein
MLFSSANAVPEQKEAAGILDSKFNALRFSGNSG